MKMVAPKARGPGWWEGPVPDPELVTTKDRWSEMRRHGF